MRPFERPIDGIPLEDQDQPEESNQRATATRTPGGSPAAGIPTPPPEAE